MYEVKMPRLGQTMENGSITTWFVKEGEFVKKGDPLFELQSEKAAIEVEAQETGVLRKILLEEDIEVPINTPIAIIADKDEEIDLSAYTDAEASANEETNKQEENHAQTEASASVETVTMEKPKVEVSLQDELTPENRVARVAPKARRLAKQLGIDLTTITGTGRNGIIREVDVRNAAASSSTIPVKETIRLNPVQRAMSQNMLISWQNIPQFTQIITVNMENVIKVKDRLENVTYNDIIVKAVANAARRKPYVNSKLEDNQITIYDEVNVSVAVNSPHGLVVPVVKNVDSKSVYQISKDVKDLVEKAKNNQLKVSDYENGTITVSNLGSMGIESGTPIINQPQSTIIFAGAIKKVPVVTEFNEIVIKPVMSLSICYDHRYIDGGKAAEFTNAVKDALEMISVDVLE